MKKALGIARVSTERQAAADRVSHEEQADRIRRWSEANGYECIDILYETISRADELDPDQRDLRPVFWRAWDRLKAGQVDAVVFWEPSRFCAALGGADFTYWLAKSRQHGDGIRFTEKEPPRDGAYAMVMAAVAGSQVAADYSGLIERMKVGREGHARQGEYAGGGLPFWLRWVRPVRNEDGPPTPGYFELREAEAALVRRIITLYQSGAGSERIANILTDEGVSPPSALNPQWRTRRSAAWNGATILDLLRNRALYGEYHLGGRGRSRRNEEEGKLKTRRQEAVAVPVPALITKDEYDAIRSRMLENRKYHTERRAKDWPLQGLIWSEACGYIYSPRADGRTGRRVYRCPGRSARRHRDDGQKCSCPGLPAEEIERQVVAALRRLLKDPDSRRSAVRDYIDHLEGRKAALAAQLEPIDNELERIQKLVDDLTMDMRQQRLSEARYEAEVDRLEARRRELRARRENFEVVERELHQVEESLTAIHEAIDGGLLHVAVISHGRRGRPSAITWADVESEDFILRQEPLADLVRRLRLRVVVRQDGQVEVMGLLEPTPIENAVRRRAGASPTSPPSASRSAS